MAWIVKVDHHLLRNNLFVILSVYFNVIVSLLSKINIFLHLTLNKFFRNQRLFNIIFFAHLHTIFMNLNFFNFFTKRLSYVRVKIECFTCETTTKITKHILIVSVVAIIFFLLCSRCVGDFLSDDRNTLR